MLDEYGASVSIEWLHHLVHIGKLHRVNHLLQSVSAATGCNFLIDVPQGVKLHWSAKYFSKFGGLLEASYDPTVSAVGTEIAPRNNNTSMPNMLKSKFYHTATATAHATNPKFYVGIPGGTGVAGTGSSGGNGEREELELKPGWWFIKINPYADSADVILNAEVYES